MALKQQSLQPELLEVRAWERGRKRGRISGGPGAEVVVGFVSWLWLSRGASVSWDENPTFLSEIAQVLIQR